MHLNGLLEHLTPLPEYILMRTRAIARDPAVYPDVDNFRPERWIDPSFPTTYREPLTQYPTLRGHHQFGHGRRTCLGIDIIEHELFLAITLEA